MSIGSLGVLRCLVIQNSKLRMIEANSVIHAIMNSLLVHKITLRCLD